MVEERKIVEKMNELEKKMKVIEGKERDKGKETRGKKETEKGKKVENRITAIERKEREERRRNIIIKRVNCNEKEKVVEKILARISEKVELESISMVIGRNDIIIMKMGSIEQKRGIMTKRYMLKGKKERLKYNLTEREKKMQRELKKIAVIE